MTDEAVRCRICDGPTGDLLRLSAHGQIYTQIPLCNAHLAAIRLGDWWLTIRLMDTTATISGPSFGNVITDRPQL